LEGADRDVDLGPAFIDPVEAAESGGGLPGDVVTVVRKRFAGGQTGDLADDSVALDDPAVTAGVLYDPFSTQQRHRPIGRVVDRDEVNEGVGSVRRKTVTTVVVDELVEGGTKAGEER
jgi:hypothetical protein